MRPGARIDYKAPRKINSEAARQAAPEYLKTNGGNIADAAEYSATRLKRSAGPTAFNSRLKIRLLDRL